MVNGLRRIRAPSFSTRLMREPFVARIERPKLGFPVFVRVGVLALKRDYGARRRSRHSTTRKPPAKSGGEGNNPVHAACGKL